MGIHPSTESILKEVKGSGWTPLFDRRIMDLEYHIIILISKSYDHKNKDFAIVHPERSRRVVLPLNTNLQHPAAQAGVLCG
jgi:hypothetical protein